MCNFLSAIYTATGKLICEPVYTDNHSELLEYARIKERATTAPVQQFVRLELVPPISTDDWPTLEAWQEQVDEHEVPAWFDTAARYDAFSQMRDIIAAAIIEEGDRQLVFGRLVIIRGGTVQVRGGRVFAWGNSTVTAWGNSTVTARDNSTVTARDNSTVTARDNSTVTALGNSTVTDNRTRAGI